MNEAQTEFEYIEPALKAAGWGVVEGSRIRKQFPISQGRLLGQGRRSKPLKADYVLQYKNRNLAVVEAKALDQYYTSGVTQAKDYAERLHIRFTYSTNGREHYEMDMELGREQDVSGFPGPQELWERSFPEENDWRERLFSVPFEDRGGTWQPRYYQENAITKTLEAIANGEDRILLTLATGTGKTAISFQIAWKLFQARWNLQRDALRAPRILFLADRNILADQAFNSFSAFEEDALVRITPGDIRKRGRVPRNGSIFFTIFQSFMSGPDQSPYFGEYPPDFFDFIIIDECHRGGARDESSWRAIMEYFKPAVQLGLTATPKRDVNGDTYKYFGEPVYTYSLKQGINDGFLTPFKVKEFSTTIDTYTYTDDDDVEWGEAEKGREYKESDFNRIIEIKERETYRVQLLMQHLNPRQKTLVFCATQAHAAAIRDLINQHSENPNPNYCHRVTAEDGKRGEQHLRDFQDNERIIPTVLTTSKKLSTGVDAPEVRNIVLLRPVNSMVEFKQIIGRGTRLFDGKDHFTIYDFVKAHKHFKDAEWDGEPIEPEQPKPRPEKEPCPECGKLNCYCGQGDEPEVCETCGNHPCVCEPQPKYMLKVKLSDHKVRSFDSMVKTSFWDPEGTPIGVVEFVERLFGDLPELFRNEEELRRIWSAPGTRRRLLEELSDRGYTADQLEELRRVVHGEESDLFDVLAYVAYTKDMLPRAQRAERARESFEDYSPAQREFLDFVLEQYVQAGERQLDDSELSDLLVLKYHSIADAKKKLGAVADIRSTFVGFQKHLYQAALGAGS